MQPGRIHDLLHRDHVRLAKLLDDAGRGPTIDLVAYGEFRGGLLRHIGMEEKILLPAIQRLRGGKPLDQARQLRLDHAAIAALLVPTPTHAIIERIRALLTMHNIVEEGSGGVYEQCEALAGVDGGKVLAELEAARPIKQAPYHDGPRAFASIERLLRAAGRDRGDNVSG